MTKWVSNRIQGTHLAGSIGQLVSLQLVTVFSNDWVIIKWRFGARTPKNYFLKMDPDLPTATNANIDGNESSC